MEAVRAGRLEIRDVLLVPLSSADLIELSGAMDEEELRSRLNYYNAPSMLSHLRRQLDSDGIRGELTWAVYRQGEPLGICGLWPFDPEASLGINDWGAGLEIIAYLNQRGRGSGVASLIGAILFEQAEAMQQTLLATIEENNPRSIAFTRKAWPKAERRPCLEIMRGGRERRVEALLIKEPPMTEELSQAEKMAIAKPLSV